MTTLKATADTITAYLTDKIEKSMQSRRELRKVNTFWRNGRGPAPPGWPLLTRARKDVSVENVTDARSEATLEVVYAAFDDDVAHDRGADTAEEIAFTVAELFIGADDWPADVTTIELQRVTSLAPTEDITLSRAEVELAIRFLYTHT
jgi:hypothetical protein